MTAPDRHPETDRAARRAAQTEFERPLVLEAGAGTGKTTTLVARILAWTVGPGWERAAGGGDTRSDSEIAATVLDGVVAITFGELGAAHLAASVARALALLAAGRETDLHGIDLEAWQVQPDPEDRRRRAGALLGALDHLTARTFHAFCRGILAAYPLEAGVHPQLVVDADGSRLRDIARIEVERTFRAALEKGDVAGLVRLAARGHRPTQVAMAVAELIEQGLTAEDLEIDPFDARGAARWLRGTLSRLEEFLSIAVPAFGSLPRGNSAEMVARIGVLRDSLAALEISGESFPEGKELLLEADGDGASLLERLRKWGKGEFNQGESAALASDESRAAAAAQLLFLGLRNTAELDPALFGESRRTLLPLVRQTLEEARHRGIATFHSLLATTDELLASRPDVTRRIRRRIELLLVDEVQDTDPLQFSIVGRLGLPDGSGSGPSLCLVGDPKQTIYGWRNADLNAYENFLEATVDAGGEVHRLSLNFRSVPEILAEVDRIGESSIHKTPGLQPAYAPLVPARPSEESHRPAVEHWIAQPGASQEGLPPRIESIRLQAVAAASEISELREEGVDLGQVAILLRTRTPLPPLLETLREAGLPFAVAGDRDYYQRREVIDATATLRAIADPNDHVALVAYLRSPWVGLPDAALEPLWQRDFPALASKLDRPSGPAIEQIADVLGQVAEALPGGLPGLERIPRWRDSVLEALESLAVLRTTLAEQPADLFVEKLRQLLGCEAVAAARYAGRFRVANLERWFRMLGAELERNGGDMRSALRLLERSVTEAREAEEALPKDATGGAVQILTIHQSKGLEFDHVFVLVTEQTSGGRGGPELKVDRSAEGPPGLVLFGTPTPGYERAALRESLVRQHEEARLLYVAATRARRRLVLGGNWPRRFPGSPGPNPTLMSMLSRRPGVPDLARLGSGGIDHDGARWRRLAGPMAPPSRTANADDPALPSVRSVRASEEALRQRRRESEERMQRPWTRSPSAVLQDGTPTWSAAEARSRGSALVVGDLFHRALEGVRTEEPPDGGWDAELGALIRPAVAGLAPENRAAVEERVEEILGRVSGGRLANRWERIRRRVHARELPYLAPPQELGQLGDPVGAEVGVIDLLYQDPDSDEWVVADYKTDRVADEALVRHADSYRAQVEAYAEAVQRALGLPLRPQCELWFLHLDRIFRWEDERPQGSEA